MSTSRQTKQARILYFCFIALVITAVVAAAVAGGLKKSETGKATVSPSADVGTVPEETTAEKSGSNSPKSDNENAWIIPRGTEKKADEPKETEGTEPAAAEPTPLYFVAPVNGLLYAEFSDTVPVFSPTMNDFRTHNGVDVAAEEGDPVFACADGVIEEIWNDPMMGKSIKISHGDGVESVYRNLDDLLPVGIEKGAAVKAGQLVAAVGSTAIIECEDEPHLHFELRVNGVNVDPTGKISFRMADDEYED